MWESSLAELGDRIEQVFYSEPCTSWSTPSLLNMAHTAGDLEDQLQQWRDSLPLEIPSFENRPEPSTLTEIQLSIWFQYSSLQLKLYRPFLYRLAHPGNVDGNAQWVIQPFAKKALRASLDPVFTVGLRERNEMTWFKARESAVRALLIVCGRRLGLVEAMGVEGEAVEMLRLFIAHLRYWEDESPDLKSARQIIEEMC